MSALSHYPQYVYSNLTPAADSRYITRSTNATLGNFPSGTTSPFTAFQSLNADAYAYSPSRQQSVTESSVAQTANVQKPGWLLPFIAAGASLAALVYLCRRLDVGNLLNSVMSSLKELPVFAQIMKALSSLSNQNPTTKTNLEPTKKTTLNHANPKVGKLSATA